MAKISKANRDTIYSRDHNKCLCCESPENLTIDHIFPLSLGGYNVIDNYQTLCTECNVKKGNKFIDYRKNYDLAGAKTKRAVPIKITTTKFSREKSELKKPIKTAPQISAKEPYVEGGNNYVGNDVHYAYYTTKKAVRLDWKIFNNTGNFHYEKKSAKIY